LCVIAPRFHRGILSRCCRAKVHAASSVQHGADGIRLLLLFRAASLRAANAWNCPGSGLRISAPPPHDSIYAFEMSSRAIPTDTDGAKWRPEKDTAEIRISSSALSKVNPSYRSTAGPASNRKRIVFHLQVRRPHSNFRSGRCRGKRRRWSVPGCSPSFHKSMSGTPCLFTAF